MLYKEILKLRFEAGSRAGFNIIVYRNANFCARVSYVKFTIVGANLGKI